jgi:hypothetical protein
VRQYLKEHPEMSDEIEGKIRATLLPDRSVDEKKVKAEDLKNKDIKDVKE